MTTKKSKNIIGAVATLLVSFSGSSLATTLTFDGGFSDNADVNGSYGSDNTADNTEFITSDGSGATPNIALTWPTANQFEYHSSAIWQVVEDVTATGDGSSHTVQMNMSVSGRTVVFTPDAGFAVVFNSVDFGIASSGNAGIGTVTITRDSDSQLVKTASTSSLSGGQAAQIDLSYTGALGESYTLEFSNSGGDNFGAIDDLSFSQTVPEPSTAALLGLGGLALILRRRK